MRAVLYRALVACVVAGIALPLVLSGQSQDAVDARFRASIDPANIRENMRRLTARPHHVGRLRQGQRRVDSGAVPGVGLGRADRDVRRAVPDAEGARARDGRADALHGDAGGAAGRRSIRHPPRRREQLPDLQRLLDRRRRHRRRWSTSTTACPQTTRSSSASASRCKGAIVIARYGGSWRGIKPKVAAEHGAIGCLIYSDPRDDGYCDGDVFPDGPMRPGDGVQRGSVMDMPTYPGDPLTPGVGATQDAKRLAAQRRDRR